MVEHRPAQARACISQHVDDYLGTLNAGASTNAAPSAVTPASFSPGVDHLLRTALVEKVPADLRPHLNLDLLLQRMIDRHLFKLQDVERVTLGRVVVNGDRASAEVYYQGALTALRLPFVKEDGAWKVDALAVLPYAEILMRLDRALRGETETQQVNRIVSRLPSL